jgi:hypothetical protein
MAVPRMALSPNGRFTDRAVHRTLLLGALSPNAHSVKTMGFPRMLKFTEWARARARALRKARATARATARAPSPSPSPSVDNG